MKRILIVEVGDPVPEVTEKKGPFHDWIIRGMGLSAAEVEIIDPRKGTPLPPPVEYRGIVVTGSSALVTDREAWSERTAHWLSNVVRTDTPLLGICYGHQLLAHGLGGLVEKNPRGREIGSIEVNLTEEAREDPLFSALPSPLKMQATHVESVIELPPGARLIGYNEKDPHQAFALERRVWSVQFHPEFDAEVAVGYVRARRELLKKEGLDPDAIANAIKESDHGRRLLTRFAELTL